MAPASPARPTRVGSCATAKITHPTFRTDLSPQPAENTQSAPRGAPTTLLSLQFNPRPMPIPDELRRQADINIGSKAQMPKVWQSDGGPYPVKQPLTWVGAAEATQTLTNCNGGDTSIRIPSVITFTASRRTPSAETRLTRTDRLSSHWHLL